MYNIDQLLFEHCTAKFSDNTQCCIPVFDICHELPLCFEHAKKRVSLLLIIVLFLDYHYVHFLGGEIAYGI